MEKGLGLDYKIIFFCKTIHTLAWRNTNGTKYRLLGNKLTAYTIWNIGETGDIHEADDLLMSYCAFMEFSFYFS